MDASPTHPNLRRDLRAIVGDGIAFSVMVGIGEAYLPAFALAAGLGELTSGLISTLPMLAGAVFQLVTPAACRRLGSHRRWVVLCAVLQAASFVPLIAAALVGTVPLSLLYLSAAAYWGFGMATSPAWNTWVGTLVPASQRARFFAARTRACQAAVLVGLLAGGLLLETDGRGRDSLVVFAGLFGVGALARLLSARFLARQSEPRPIPLGVTRASPRAFLAHGREGGHGRLLLFLLAFQLSVWIAAAWFTPYMLRVLGLSYLEFTILTGVAFLARVVALPLLGRLAHRAGPRQLLWLGGLGIVPLPSLWLVSDAYAWLVVLQMLSGVAWAAFELATLLSFFEHIPEASRTSVLSMYNLANAAALVGGSLIGAHLIDSLPGEGAYVAVFLLSSAARVLALPLLRGVPDVAVSGPPPPLRELSVRPSVGAIERPILAALPDDDERTAG